LISRTDYDALGGHSAVKESIVEDMSLGLRLKSLGLPFHDFIGDRDISFRMYGGGPKSLLEGWTKNLASGAATISVPVFLLTFLWISSLISVPYHLILALGTSNFTGVAFFAILYAVWSALLLLLSKKLGRFSPWALLLFPIPLIVFAIIFVLSAVKKIFRLKVRWKGRDIPLEGTQCD
jgi:4,4'-diaponeurosporenoate glycosyltransferase